VIEDDGKTEDEFVIDLLAMNDALIRLNYEAHNLGGLITHNMSRITGEV
jgi:type I restriction enzyme M protein